MHRALTSIHAKVFAVIFALTATLILGLATFFPARELSMIGRTLERKCTVNGRLLAKEVEPGVAFDDPDSVREVFEAAVLDDDIRGLAAYKKDGSLLFASKGYTAPAAPEASETLALTHVPGSIRVATPVVSKGERVGTLLVDVTTAGLDAERTQIRRIALASGGGALLVAFLVSFGIGRSLARRLRAVAKAADAVASGDMDGSALDESSRDELGHLSRAFNAMRNNVRSLIEEVRAVSAEEKKRAGQLSERTHEMRLVLDNIDQGLFIVDREGTLVGERSHALVDFLGAPEEGDSIWGYAGRADSAVGTWMHMGWEAVRDDVLPLELALDQLPKAMRRGSRQFQIGYRPITVDGELSRLLCVVTDVTAQLAQERADAEQRELLVLFERVVNDRGGFVEFFVEADAIVKKIVAATELSSELRRSIHTLKGNCGLFGLTTLANKCHALEGTIADSSELPSDAELRDLSASWNDMAHKMSGLLGHLRARIEIDEREYEGLITSILGGTPRQKLAHDVWLWRLEPVVRRLERIEQQVHALAPRLGKSGVSVVIEHGGLRLDSEAWAPFWAAFVHVIRNALDHGIETHDEREAAGKTGDGTLSVRTYLSCGEFIVEAADDGRGIDWAAVAERGRELGLPHETREQQEALLFRDGVSTKREATEFSGRGVGMAAAREACAALGGHIRIQTRRHEGTVMQFRFPAAAMGDSFAEPSNVPRMSLNPAA